MAEYLCSYAKCGKPITSGPVVVDLKDGKPRYWHGKPINCDEKHVVDTNEQVGEIQVDFSQLEKLAKELAMAPRPKG